MHSDFFKKRSTEQIFLQPIDGRAGQNQPYQNTLL